MALTKVGPKFQVTIPKVARDALGIRAGDIVEARVQGREIVLRPKIVVDRDPELGKPGAAMKATKDRARHHRDLRRRLEQGYRESAEGDLRLAEEWFGEAAEAWPDAKRRGR